MGCFPRNDWVVIGNVIGAGGKGEEREGMMNNKNNTHQLSENTLEMIDCLRNCGSYGGVFLYYGHDGDNGCQLKDFDSNPVLYECSGRSMDEAVQKVYVAHKTLSSLKDHKRPESETETWERGYRDGYLSAQQQFAKCDTCGSDRIGFTCINCRLGSFDGYKPKGETIK